METKDVLIEARKLIERPEMWGKGRRNVDRPRYTFCAAECIEAQNSGYTAMGEAFDALFAATGAQPGISIPMWNDDARRTHAEVLAAFDKAIAAA
jgi:hypothetical protein